jgi:hypothetical protein
MPRHQVDDSQLHTAWLLREISVAFRAVGGRIETDIMEGTELPELPELPDHEGVRIFDFWLVCRRAAAARDGVAHGGSPLSGRC